VLIFCFFLFNNKKKARPAGHTRWRCTSRKPSAVTPNEKIKGRDAQDAIPYEVPGEK